MNNCDLCGKEGLTEFTVTSKHLRWILSEDLQKLDTHKNNWLTKNICEDCFKKIFGKPEENYTIEQNAGENTIEGGVVSVSGSVEKQYRPFNDCNELIEYYQRKYESAVGCDIYFPSLYKPNIWVKSKEYGTDNLITAFDNDNESIGGSCVFIQDMWVDMKELFDNFTFLDGSPVGKLEEE